MIARRTVVLSAAIVAALGVVACHRKDEASAADPKAVAAAQAAISSPAWLRQHLPAQTVAYMRFPSLWAVAGGVPNGRPLDAALSTKANLDAIATVRGAIAKDTALADARIGPALSLVLGELRSPIEVALIDPLGIPAPTSRVVATAALSFDSVDAFNKQIATLFTTPVLAAPLDAQGNGKLVSGGAVRYVVAEHRLWITQSMQQPSDGGTLDELIGTFGKSTAATAPATLSALEARIDTSGQGLFGWASIRGVGGVAAAQAGDNPMGKLPADFASKADAVAFGGGTVDGRGQFRMVVHAPQARLLQYIAPRSFSPDFKTVGKPRWAMSVALPGAEGYKAFEDNLNLDFGPENAGKVREALAKMRQTYGFNVADYTKWLGPESVAFADDAGDFFAIRARDRKAWYARIDEMTKAGRWRSGEVTIDDAHVHWLFMPGAPYLADKESAVGEQVRPYLAIAQRVGTRLYWVEEGDWIVLAKVPQALADRAAGKPDTSIADWYRDRAYPGVRTLIGFTATSHGAQRDAYYAYIQFLQLLGGIAGCDIDISTLPSAHTLGLPADGVIGAAIETDQDTLGLSLTYEQAPTEFIGQSNAGGAVAGMAIVAAIAVPQYQQYTLRSQVTAALGAAEPAKKAVADRRLAAGKFPSSNKAAGLGPADSLGNEYAGSVEVGQGGEIAITLDDQPPHKADPKLTGGRLVLMPEVEAGRVNWICAGDGIDERYLPATCKGQLPGL